MLLLVWSYVFADGLDCRRVVLGSKCVAELNLPLPLIDIVFVFLFYPASCHETCWNLWGLCSSMKLSLSWPIYAKF